jgi:hypothetical protein
MPRHLKRIQDVSNESDPMFIMMIYALRLDNKANEWDLSLSLH